ncbi:MAG: response regulator, partial [Rhodospirillales bacterium]
MPTILVADDEPDFEMLVRQRFRRRIRSGELEFLFAADGRHALQTLTDNPAIDVLLTDINMPRMDGLALLNELADVRPDIRAVVVSAYGDMDNIRSAMNSGAFDFVTKPIDFQDLEITLNKTIEHVALLRDAEKQEVELASIRRELEVARRLQQSILPRQFPKDARYE